MPSKKKICQHKIKQVTIQIRKKNNKENSGMDQVKLSHDQVKQSQKQSQVTSS